MVEPSDNLQAVFEKAIETAKKLFDEPNKVSAIQILCENGKSDDVQLALQEKLGDKFEVKNRYQLNDVLFNNNDFIT